MIKKLVCIGGGKIRSKETLEIDAYCASLARLHAGEVRPTAVFVGTASHDSLPYFNSFRKTYTSNFDIKADLALLTKKDIPMDKIKDKLLKANLIYVGGGNTLFMLETWRNTGFLELIIDAYLRGVPIVGLSAGAICWFKDMYTDSQEGSDYALQKGLGILDGLMSPHYDNRAEFDDVAKDFPLAYAIENKSAIVFEDGVLKGSLTSGGNAYVIKNGVKEIVKNINLDN